MTKYATRSFLSKVPARRAYEITGQTLLLFTARFKHTLPRKSSGGKAARLGIILAAKSACKLAPVTGGINEPHPEASPMAPHATAGYAPTAVLLTGGAGFIGSHGK